MHQYAIPTTYFLVQDMPRNVQLLEKYYNDLYKLLLNKLVQFDHSSETDEAERERLKEILGELIYAKSILEEGE